MGDARPAGRGARGGDPAAVGTAWKRPARCRVVSVFPVPPWLLPSSFPLTGRSAGMTRTHDSGRDSYGAPILV